MHTTVPVLRGVARRVRRTAQRVVATTRVGGDRQQDPAHVGEQERPLTEVRLPLHLHGVGDVEPLDRARPRSRHEHVGAGVAVEIGEADPSAALEDPGRVATGGRASRPTPRWRGSTPSGRSTARWRESCLVPGRGCAAWARACARAASGVAVWLIVAWRSPESTSTFRRSIESGPQAEAAHAAKSRPRPVLFTRLSRGAPRGRRVCSPPWPRAATSNRPGGPGGRGRSTREIVDGDPRIRDPRRRRPPVRRTGCERHHDGRDRPRRSGLRQSSLYYYFHNKEHVLEAIVVEANRVPLARRRAGPTRGRTGGGPALPDHPRRRGGLVGIALRPERDPPARRAATPRPSIGTGRSGRCWSTR